MTHGDDDGMMMPPKVAPVQVQIVPILRGEDESELLSYCDRLRARLKEAGIRVRLEGGDARTPDKIWGGIKQGIPLRVEIGERERTDGQVTHVRRDIGRRSKRHAARMNSLRQRQVFWTIFRPACSRGHRPFKKKTRTMFRACGR